MKTKTTKATTKTKKPVTSVTISRKDGERMSLEEVIGLNVWAEVEGYKINAEDK